MTPRLPRGLPEYRAGRITRTCASSRVTSARTCSSRTSGRRSGQPCSRRTATRSVMAGGCSCTTGSSTASRRSSGTWCSRSTNRCFPRSRAKPTPRSCSTWRAHLRPGRRPAGRCRARHRVRREGARAAAGHHPHPFQGTIATSTVRACGCSAIRARADRGRCSSSRDARAVKRQYPERPALQQLSDDARFVVSEPIGDLPGAWAELPEASYGAAAREVTSSLGPLPPNPHRQPGYWAPS